MRLMSEEVVREIPSQTASSAAIYLHLGHDAKQRQTEKAKADGLVMRIFPMNLLN